MDVMSIGISANYEGYSLLPEQTADAATVCLELPDVTGAVLFGVGEGIPACLAVEEYANSVPGPVIVTSDSADPPGWAGKRTLLVVVDPAGGSFESRSAIYRAMNKGCTVVVIASNGRTLENAKEKGLAYVEIPPFPETCGSFGSCIGALCAILSSAGLRPAVEDLEEAMTPLRYYRDNLLREPDGQVESASAILAGCPSSVYAFDGMVSAGYVWAESLSGNAGSMAFCGAHPEFNHNEIAGWGSGDAKAKSLVHIALYDRGASELSRALVDASLENLRQMGIRTLVCRFYGVNSLEKILKSALLGLFVSARLDNVLERSAEPVVGDLYPDFLDLSD